MTACYVAPYRHICIIMVILVIILGFYQRVTLNLAIIEMVDTASSKSPCQVPLEKSSNISIISGKKERWTKLQQAIILSSYSAGYVLLHVPGSIICDRWGAKFPLIVGVTISSISTAAVPPAVHYTHWTCVGLLRVMMGASQGVIFPAAAYIIDQWVVPSERSCLLKCLYSGSWVGITVGILTTGSSIVLLKNWETSFYIAAFFGLYWIIFSFSYVQTKPSDNPTRVTPNELEMLKKIPTQTSETINFTSILRDDSVWGLTIGQLGHHSVMTFFTVYLPIYMNTVLRYNIMDITMLAYIPFTCMHISGLLCESISGCCLQKKRVNVTCVRKLNAAMDAVTSGSFMILLGYTKCSKEIGLAYLSAVLFCKGFYYGGLRLNSDDISINHHRLVKAFTNGVGSLGGLITPIIIIIVFSEEKLNDWTVVFYILALLQLVTTVAYLVLGSAVRAKWDFTNEELSPPVHTSQKS